MELDAASIDNLRSGRLTMHVNKVHHVKTISRVANELGENEDWLFDDPTLLRRGTDAK